MEINNECSECFSSDGCDCARCACGLIFEMWDEAFTLYNDGTCEVHGKILDDDGNYVGSAETT